MDSPAQLPVTLSVSIVLHNNPIGLLRLALESLYQSSLVAREAGYLREVSVYVVDNASDEEHHAPLATETERWSQDAFFKLHFLPLPCNLGFGHGHNTVLGKLTSDVHLVLNPDVELEAGALKEGFFSLLNAEDIVLLSPRVFGAEGQQEFLCKRYPSVLVLLLRGFAPEFVCRMFRAKLAAYEMRDHCGGEERAEISIASGCFMLVRTSALRAVAGFNEDFFLYFEDFDLSLRLANQGRLIFEPAMRIIHLGGYASSKGLKHLKYFLASGIRFFNRHGWRWM